MSDLAFVGPTTGGNPMVQIGRIREFLAYQVRPEQKPRCGSVALAHFTETGPEVLRTHQWSPARDENELIEVSHRFEEAAVGHSSTHTRPQRYRVVAYDSKGLSIIDTHEFLVAPPIKTNLVGAGSETEPPNEMGLTSQGMRLIEVQSRLLVDAQAHLLREACAEVDRLRTRCSQLEENLMRYTSEYTTRSMAQMTAYESLVNRKWERDLKLQEQEEKNELARTAMGYLKQLAPALIEHATDGKVSASMASMGVDGLSAFLKSLRPEQLVSIAQSAELTPEQKQLLVEQLTPEQYAELERAAGRNGQ